MEKFGKGSVGVLLIPPLMERNAQTVVNQLSSGQQYLYTFYNINPIPRSKYGLIDHESVLEKCRKLIRSEGIKVLFANKPISVMVMSVLCEEFPHLRGPSVESVFLCNHKYYTNLHIDSTDNALPYTYRMVEDDRFDLAAELIKAFTKPAIVRFALGSGHTVFKYHNRDQLLKVLLQCQNNIYHVIDQQRWLINKYVDCEKYELAAEPVVIIQPYLDRCLAPRGSTWQNVSIEACVCNKEVIPWSICDGVTLPYNNPNPTQYFCGSEMPTKLTSLQQGLLWKVFTKDIMNLINAGFDNGFLHAEYMVFENDMIHLITMNSRLHAKCVHMYKLALVQGNNVKASLDLARGLRPRTPKLSGRYVLNYSMVVFSSWKADDLIHFSKAKSNDSVHLNYLQNEEIAIEPAKDFIIFGYITVTGENFADCTLEIKRIRNEILKHPMKVPFTE